MKKTGLFVLTCVALMSLAACGNKEKTEAGATENQAFVPKVPNENQIDRFADIQVLAYQIEDWDKLSLNQKKLVYFLSQAGMAGRDIIYDQNFIYNLEIRKTLESIYENYNGNRDNADWFMFDEYAKRVFFSNGIHHHYGMDKIMPLFSKEYFTQLLQESNSSLSDAAMEAVFSTDKYMKRKVKDDGVDFIVASANNFYGDGVTQQMVEDFYAARIDKNNPRPVEYGLNSTLVLRNGELYEDVWKSGGKYGPAIDQIIFWLKQAVDVAENSKQAAALRKLIEYYQTGDLKTWDDYNVLWVASTEGDIDYINGFIEVYGDAAGRRASYESIVQITDFEASAQMKKLGDNAQWFEDNSTILPEHKKKNVKGVSYKVVQVASESGDASPSTPIGVNLPNNNWIREEHGSKSVSLGNIISAYDKAGGTGMLSEFAHDEEEIARVKEYGSLAGKMHTSLHEVIGHASGVLNKGVGQPNETLKNYASTLEEARADLVGLYFIMDPKLVEMGLLPGEEVGKAEYDTYIRNGLMTQLLRIELGKNIEEEHMQNRQLVAAWVMEKGAKDNVIEKVVREGKTYFNINDYQKLRVLFGELLRDIQRIKSEGDFEAGKALVEKYGVKVDQDLHKEVLERVKPLDIAPYSGFVNPVLVPVKNDAGEIIDIKIEYPGSFIEQMLQYGKNYSFL